MGRHLYLIACPSQHSLTSCFIGSLSHVSGFLPADKELHEQRPAYRSSSSSDLDEDTSKHQVEQDSCQPVLRTASEDDSDLSFPHVTSKDEVAVAGGEPKVSCCPEPRQPQQQLTTQERELHTTTHIPSSSWCVECQEAKERAVQLRNLQPSIKTSTIQLQYVYMRQPQAKEPTMILTWVESLTGLAAA